MESVSAQGREGRGFDSDPGQKTRDSEVTLSHWSHWSIELVIMPLIDL
jgi:ferric iron reductase protein FhuF